MLVWTADPDHPYADHNWQLTSEPIVANDLVFVVGEPFAGIFAFRTTDGSEEWNKREIRYDYNYHRTPLTIGQTIYAVSEGDYIYALDINSGDTVWKFYHGGEHNLPRITTDGRTIFVYQGRLLYAVNTR